jgi:LysR family cys regulon transcriptional activator
MDTSIESVTLQQLRYLVAIAESGRYRLTGAVIRDQSTVSRGIKELERALGAPLFSPEDRCRLTPLGAEMVASAVRIMGELAAMKRRVEDAAAGRAVRGTLLIGAKQALAGSSLRDVLLELRKKYPRLEIRVKSAGGAGLLAMLARGEIEVAFSHERPHAEEMEFHPVHRLRRMILAPKRHPIIKARRLSAKAVAAWPIVLPERNGRTARDVIERIAPLAPRGRLAAPIEVMGADVRSRYVLDGWGIAIIEEGRDFAVLPGLATRLVPESILPSRAVGVYRIRNRYLRAGAEAFIGMCRKIWDSPPSRPAAVSPMSSHG